jgi:regulator of protease activity HflC (stomatin/prohibitin superfamily)
VFGKKTIIFEGFAGLHFHQGRLLGVLPAGKHSNSGSGHQISAIDLRPTTSVVGGQEVTTQDGAGFKISIVLGHQIEDPALNYRSAQGGLAGVTGMGTGGGRLHQLGQIAIREWVTTRTFKDAFEQRASLPDAIQPGLQAACKELGIKLISVALLDFSVVGSLRTAYADLLKAQIEGEAALARARNESATMRNLLNTARLVREHPGLLELRVLASGQKPRVTFVVGGGNAGAFVGSSPEPNADG